MKLKLSGYYKLPHLTSPISFDFEDVFNTAFMKKYTRYKTFEQFLNNGRFNISDQKDFENLPEKSMNIHVAKNTKFKTWQEMIDFATDRYIKKNINRTEL
ncbi:hypothetical protein [Pectinatus haikarae]|uniref:Uncharacterized protein n=1 Tax=Pectinatus haikarae TaxID=349096 RepID=A0ABT9Y7Q3_9FIRM|nr:hypothetical protein [Pectinatus haikarae]MDQ0203868.1 hypothetical protein [Pectinatus haikarae]